MAETVTSPLCDICERPIEWDVDAVGVYTPPDLLRPSSVRHIWCEAGEPPPDVTDALAQALTGMLETLACTGDEPEVPAAREALVAAGYPDPLGEP